MLLIQNRLHGLRIRTRIYILHRARLGLWAAALSAPPPETPSWEVSPRNPPPWPAADPVFVVVVFFDLLKALKAKAPPRHLQTTLRPAQLERARNPDPETPKQCSCNSFQRAHASRYVLSHHGDISSHERAHTTCSMSNQLLHTWDSNAVMLKSGAIKNAVVLIIYLAS